MAVFKCKMCGGDLRIIEGQTVCECEYCGSRQTVPMLDSEKKVTLFARANRLRSMCEFDKAYSVYESIVADFPEEAEAYWGLVLCKYGIEYVDDPTTGKKIPTCHRSSFDNVMEDGNFELVMEYSDAIARPVYRAEAKEIERLRSGILEVSSKEKPYDIFICYKETDDKDDRTIDSLIAQDVYDALTEEGYRVFFSRISLEDKLGQEYEPYIFSALHSAKIMLVFGTSYDNFNAVWVKNEWSRFLSMIVKGEKKTLIPCYKDVDAYDMPQEFRKLQAQDMGKVGARQDLLRGIEKILSLKKVQKTSVDTARSSQQSIVDPLLKRAFLFLEDGDWEKADEYCEKILDIEPENAHAYLGKLMVDLKVCKLQQLKDQHEPFDNQTHYQKAIRFADNELKTVLLEAISLIKQNKDAEKAKVAKKARQIADALHEGTDSKTLSLKDQYDSMREKGTYLIGILNSFDELQEQANSLIVKLNDIDLQETTISEQRLKLGIFASKEKKRIDEEKIALSAKRNAINNHLKEIKNKCGGYETRANIEKDLAEINNDVSKIERQMACMLSDTGVAYSFDEAWKLYSTDKELAHLVNMEYPLARFSPAIQGKTNTIVFGQYIQKVKGSPEPIEWKVLVKEPGRMLIISKFALDCIPFHLQDVPITWETCLLRRWLNESFFHIAFDPEERKLIQSATVKAENNPSYQVPPGNDTTDKVFLLSVSEAMKYFSTEAERQCQGTAYCNAKDPQRDREGNCVWWLRSPGRNPNTAANVRDIGSIYSRGHTVNYYHDTVRPALWIDLGADN